MRNTGGETADRLHFVLMADFVLLRPAGGGIAEGDDCTDDAATGHAGRDFAFDGKPLAGALRSDETPRDLGGRLRRIGREDEAVGIELSGEFAKGEDHGDFAVAGFVVLPSGESFGGTIHVLDAAIEVDHDHGVRHGAEHGFHPGPLGTCGAVGTVFVNSHLNRRGEAGLVDGLGEEAESFGHFGAVDGGLIGVCGEVDDRDVGRFAQFGRGLDAVHGALDADVHEDEIGADFAHRGESLFGGFGDPRDRVAGFEKTRCDMTGDDAFVFDDENAGGALIVVWERGNHDELIASG